MELIQTSLSSMISFFHSYIDVTCGTILTQAASLFLTKPCPIVLPTSALGTVTYATENLSEIIKK